MGVNTGTNRSRGGLQVNDNNGASTVFAYGVNEIVVTAGTLTNNGQGKVTIATGGGGGGGSGTVTSITNAADSGTGTAITTSGTFTYTGGTNITTAVSGTTVTINSDSASTVAAGTTNQVAYYTGTNALGGNANFTFDGTTVEINGTSGGTSDHFRVTLTGGSVSTPFVVDEVGHVGIGAANPVAGAALTLNGDGSTYEGIMFQVNTDNKFRLVQDGSAFYLDSQVNTYDMRVRLKDNNGDFIHNIFSGNTVGELRQGINIDNAANVDAPLHVATPATSSSATNTVSSPIRMSHQTSGTPAAGIGTGIEFETQTAAANEEVGATITSVATDVTSTQEDFDMVFNLMENGAAAAEKMRIGSNGAIQFNNAYTFPTADGNANEILQTDGAGNITFAAAGSGSPAGADTQIQFNNAGSFGANANFVFDTANTRLGVGESTPTAALHVSGGTANIVAKFLSTDATASIELADNSTTNNVALTRTGQTLSLCNNGGAVQIGTALGGTSVTFSQSASDGATEGGNIISNTLQVGMEINTGVATQQEIGMRQTTTAYQVETGKTTTQSFGQTQKTVIAASGTPYDCYPSEGGLIVVNDAGGAGAITLNLVIAYDGVSYTSNANPPNLAGGGTPVTGVPDKPGYGTWQIGDQVTIVANNESGNVPAISVTSTALLNNGAGGSGDPIDDAAAAAKINGVNSFTTPNTITTNFTAKTYILVENLTDILGVAWVAIG